MVEKLKFRKLAKVDQMLQLASGEKVEWYQAVWLQHQHYEICFKNLKGELLKT